MGDRNFNISITLGTMSKGILLGLGLWLLYYLRDLVVILLTAVVIASAVEPAAAWFVRNRVPRTLAVIIIYLAFFGSFLGFFFVFMPPILTETASFLSMLPQYLESFNQTDPLEPLIGSAVHTVSISDLILELRDSVYALSTNALSAASVIFGGVYSFLLILVFSFYFAMQETGIDDFVRFVTPIKHHGYVLGLWKRSQHKIGLWIQGQLLLCVIVGVLVFMGLTILGVQYALVLAVLAGLFEIIPVFGPTLSAIPAVAVALVDGGIGLGIGVVVLYVIIQQFENHLIYPLVVTKVVGVPPILIIIALIVGAQLAGFLGIVLSVPVAAAVQELVKDIERRKYHLSESRSEASQS